MISQKKSLLISVIHRQHKLHNFMNIILIYIRSKAITLTNRNYVRLTDLIIKKKTFIPFIRQSAVTNNSSTKKNDCLVARNKTLPFIYSTYIHIYIRNFQVNEVPKPPVRNVSPIEIEAKPFTGIEGHLRLHRFIL